MSVYYHTFVLESEDFTIFSVTSYVVYYQTFVLQSKGILSQ